MSRKSVVRLTDRPDMTFDVYRGRKTTTQQQQPKHSSASDSRLSKRAKGLTGENAGLKEPRWRLSVTSL